MGLNVFDDRICELGEGPLWHPGRQQLFWFDILGNRLLSRSDSDLIEWAFDRHVSAAGRVGRDRLLIASETDLFTLNLGCGAKERVAALEADNPVTRSNDGRADPFGGFWIGTMGKRAEPGAGAIYRYYKGELRQLFPGITIPNAICFSPDRRHACFADTALGKVWRVRLSDTHGWPVDAPELFLDHGRDGPNPDGAVIDTSGLFWCAEWGSARVRAYDGAGAPVRTIGLPTSQPSCPAFGGPDLRSLFVTTAREHMDEATRASEPGAGKTYAMPDVAEGQAEHEVAL